MKTFFKQTHRPIGKLECLCIVRICQRTEKKSSIQIKSMNNLRLNLKTFYLRSLDLAPVNTKSTKFHLLVKLYTKKLWGIHFLAFNNFYSATA